MNSFFYCVVCLFASKNFLYTKVIGPLLTLHDMNIFPRFVKYLFTFSFPILALSTSYSFGFYLPLKRNKGLVLFYPDGWPVVLELFIEKSLSFEMPLAYIKFCVFESISGTSLLSLISLSMSRKNFFDFCRFIIHFIFGGVCFVPHYTSSEFFWIYFDFDFSI